MKRTIICSLPFKPNIQKVLYKDTGMTLATTNREVRFPINAILDANLKEDDEIKIILVVKKDQNKYYEENQSLFLEELDSVCIDRKVSIKIDIIYSDFSENKEVHDKLFAELIDKIEDDSHIIADVTYGPKDIPVVFFSVLSFCEKHLGCDVDGIIYGLAQFGDHHDIVEGKMCDMNALFFLNSISSTVQCGDSEKARQLLKTLLSF